MQYHAIIVTTQKPNLKETEMETIMSPNFTGRIAKIIAEVRSTCIDKIDAEAIEVIEELLQDELLELNEYCRMLDEYYIEEYHNAIARVRSKAYDAGYDDGYSDGRS